MNSASQKDLQEDEEPGIDFYIRHYARLLWRWKWYIGIVSPLLFVGIMGVVVLRGVARPVLESSAKLQFDEGGGHGIQPVDMVKESRDAHIRSRSFLAGIVEKLSLQLSVQKRFRSEIFDSIVVDKKCPSGRYELVIDKVGNFSLLYTSGKRQGIVRQSILAGRIADLDNFSSPELFLKFGHEYLSDPFPFSFYVASQREAIDDIQNRLSTRFFGEQGPIMSVTLKGRDYPLITQVVNTLADDFAFQNTQSRQVRQIGEISGLEKKLQDAKSVYAAAEASVRTFRGANPAVEMRASLPASLGEVSALETSSVTIKNALADADFLRSRCVNASGNPSDILSATSGIVSFLSTHQSIMAASLSTTQSELLNEKNRLEAGYSPEHPLVIENTAKIGKFASMAIKTLDETISRLQSGASTSEARKKSIVELYQKLPAKEMAYADLERKRLSSSDAYTSALSAYNQIKDAEAKDMGDVFVLDHAVVPLMPGRLNTMMQLILIVLAVSLVVGLAPPVVVDYLDKKPRNEEDCRRFSMIPYLEAIPLFDEKVPRTIDKEKLDPKLVVAGFSTRYFDEMYRSLRTKILLHLGEEKVKHIVVTSLSMGDGKSLTASNLAITMAQQKLRTILIDGDLRRGVIHNSFVLDRASGLADILSSAVEINEKTLVPFVKKTHLQYLSVITSGMLIPNPSELMNSDRFRNLCDYLVQCYDVIILDTPPLSAAVDATILPESFNHYVVVVRTAKTDLVELDKKIDEFPLLRSKLLGLVLNGVTVNSKLAKARYSYYQTARTT